MRKLILVLIGIIVGAILAVSSDSEAVAGSAIENASSGGGGAAMPTIMAVGTAGHY